MLCCPDHLQPNSPGRLLPVLAPLVYLCCILALSYPLCHSISCLPACLDVNPMLCVCLQCQHPGFSNSPVLEHNSGSGILALWYARSNQTSLPLHVFDSSAYGCSDRVAAARQAPAAEAAPAPSQAPPAAPQKLSREELDNKLRGCLEEYFSARDKTEVSETVKELQDKTEAAQIFEQIPLVAVGKMRGVDWRAITVSPGPICSPLSGCAFWPASDACPLSSSAHPACQSPLCMLVNCLYCCLFVTFNQMHAQQLKPNISLYCSAAS